MFLKSIRQQNLFAMKESIKSITYKEIVNDSIFNKDYTIIFIYNSSYVGSYLTELSLLEIVKELNEEVSLYKIDEIGNEKIIADYKMFEKSNILIYKSSKLIEKISGLIPPKKLKEIIQENIR